MKDLLIVAKYSFKEMVKRKSFIVGTMIMVLIILIGTNIPNIINLFNEEETVKEKIVIQDNMNVYENMLNDIDLSNTNYEITLVDDELESIKENIKDEKYDMGLIITKDENNQILFNYVIKDIYTTSFPEDLYEFLTQYYTNIQLSKLNLSDEQLSSLYPTFSYDYTSIEEEGNGNSFIMILLTILLFYAIFYCAMAVSTSITTEKTSKIIETLVTSTSPRNIILGKTLGIGCGGLLQFLIVLISGIVCSLTFLDREMISAFVDLSVLTPSVAIVTVIYFLLGYFLYAILFALTGSTVDKPEDIQSANSPVSIISVISFYVAYFGMMNPNASINTIASFVPFSAAFNTPIRYLLGFASPLDVVISMLIMVASIVVIAYISIKIYSNAILNTGNRLSIQYLIKMFKQK